MGGGHRGGDVRWKEDRGLAGAVLVGYDASACNLQCCRWQVDRGHGSIQGHHDDLRRNVDILPRGLDIPVDTQIVTLLVDQVQSSTAVHRHVEPTILTRPCLAKLGMAGDADLDTTDRRPVSTPHMPAHDRGSHRVDRRRLHPRLDSVRT
jgi:hypothetical protein